MVELTAAVREDDALAVGGAHPGCLKSNIISPHLLASRTAAGSALVSTVDRMLRKVHLSSRMLDGLLVALKHVACVGQHGL